MKNLLKLSALTFTIAFSVTACDPSHKPSTPVDTSKVDTAKKDAVAVKGDTTHLDTVTKKK